LIVFGGRGVKERNVAKTAGNAKPYHQRHSFLFMWCQRPVTPQVDFFYGTRRQKMNIANAAGNAELNQHATG